MTTGKTSIIGSTPIAASNNFPALGDFRSCALAHKTSESAELPKFWRQFVGRYDGVVAETVFQREALFHVPDEESGFTERIDLESDVAEGLIGVESADTAALARVSRCIDGIVIIHDGELESLAILDEGDDDDDCVFCAADGRSAGSGHSRIRGPMHLS